MLFEIEALTKSVFVSFFSSFSSVVVVLTIHLGACRYRPASFLIMVTLFKTIPSRILATYPPVLLNIVELRKPEAPLYKIFTPMVGSLKPIFVYNNEPFFVVIALSLITD